LFHVYGYRRKTSLAESTRKQACSLGLSATSQQYFSLRTNQPPATSRNQLAVLFSQNKPAPAISHQPTEQAVLFLFFPDPTTTFSLALPSHLAASLKIGS
jgi:hypothetical protein